MRYLNKLRERLNLILAFLVARSLTLLIGVTGVMIVYMGIVTYLQKSNALMNVLVAGLFLFSLYTFFYDSAQREQAEKGEDK